MPKRKAAEVWKDGRRRHHHWRVTIYFDDGMTFARMYKDLEKARRFAKRQKKSLVVERTRITLIS